MSKQADYSDRMGPWCCTYTGRRFYALDPRPEDLCIEDIAHSLALQCRFAGHCSVPYSVADHSVRVARVVGQRSQSRAGERARLMLAALLHDASEAYLVDIPRPIKPELKEYKTIELRVQSEINAWAKLSPLAHQDALIAHADDVLLATEKRDLMPRVSEGWPALPEPLKENIRPLAWGDAKEEFLREFHRLSGLAASGGML